MREQEIIFNEAGIVRRIKGMIIKEDESFLTVETEHRIFKINKAIVIKIEESRHNE